MTVGELAVGGKTTNDVDGTSVAIGTHGVGAASRGFDAVVASHIPRALTLAERIEKNDQKKRMMEKLNHFRREEDCPIDVGPFIEPYVNDSLVNMIRGETVVRFSAYLCDLKGKVMCDVCFCFGHVASLCTDKKGRCGRCFHFHSPTATCYCPHTNLFLEWCVGQFGI